MGHSALHTQLLLSFDLDCRQQSRLRNITGRWIGGAGYQATDTVLKLGHNDVLDGSDLTDRSNRTASIVTCAVSIAPTMKNGAIRLDAPNTNVTIAFGGNKNNHLIDGLLLDIAGAITVPTIGLASTSGTKIRNVTCLTPGGRSGTAYTVRVSSGVPNSLVDGITDANGSSTYLGGTGSTYADCPIKNASWRDPATGPSSAAATVALAASYQERTLTLSRAGAQTVTCSDATVWGVGTSVRLVKTGSSTLTVTSADAATVLVDPSITLPAAVNLRLTATKMDGTTFLVHR